MSNFPENWKIIFGSKIAVRYLRGKMLKFFTKRVLAFKVQEKDFIKESFNHKTL